MFHHMYTLIRFIRIRKILLVGQANEVLSQQDMKIVDALKCLGEFTYMRPNSNKQISWDYSHL